MWGGKLHFTTAMLFAIGLIVEFTIGGLSGVTHSVSPSDTQQTDTYYIVAHFHYVLFGGAVFGLFAGFYYWWPKVFGKTLSEKIGKWNFWLMVIGMNLTFGPMHILGLQGQPRRMVVWDDNRTGDGLLQPRLLEPGVHRRFLHPGHRHLPVRRQRHRHGPQEAALLARPVGRAHAGVDDVEPAEGAQLRRHPEGPRPRRVLPPQVRGGRDGRGTEAGQGHARPRRSTPTRKPTPTSTSTCRRRRTGRSSLAVALPIIAYGIIFSRWLSIIGVAIVLLGAVRLGARAVRRRRRRLRRARTARARRTTHRRSVRATAARAPRRS